MQTHDVPFGIVQEQSHMLEINHAMQSLSQIMKQTGEITLDRDCFRDFQQGLVLLSEGLAGRCGMPIHGAKYRLKLLTSSRGVLDRRPRMSRNSRSGLAPLDFFAPAQRILSV